MKYQLSPFGLENEEPRLSNKHRVRLAKLPLKRQPEGVLHNLQLRRRRRRRIL
jgi:hypothetical protein